MEGLGLKAQGLLTLLAVMMIAVTRNKLRIRNGIRTVLTNTDSRRKKKNNSGTT